MPIEAAKAALTRSLAAKSAAIGIDETTEVKLKVLMSATGAGSVPVVDALLPV